jgi:hypothetical protein
MASQTEVYEAIFHDFCETYDSSEGDILYSAITALGGGLQRTKEITF